MIKRRLSVLMGLVASLLAVAGALPVTAQAGLSGFSVSFKDPTPRGGEVISGIRTITVEANAPGPSGGTIKSVNVSLKKANGDVVKSFDRNYCASGGDCALSESAVTESVSYPWDTNGLTPANGIYQLLVVVTPTSSLFDSAIAEVKDIKVNNAPATPGNLTVSAPVLGDPRLGLSWGANNGEPDLVGYRLSRSMNGGSFTQIAVIPQPTRSYIDTGLPFDVPIRYQLTAYRSSPVDITNGISSAPTPATTATTIRPLPPPPIDGGTAANPTGPGPKALSSDPTLRLGTGSTTPGGVAPVIIPPQAPIIGPRRDGGSGFNRLLDFGASPPQVEIDETTEGSAFGNAITSPGRLITEQLRVNPVRFVAAAFLLLVTAGHLGRAARRLLLPSADGAPTTPLAA
ncbi:MAG: hypothetical protein ACR2FO_07825 [Actinomycetota bacterium]